jgi:hypothetical protein
VKRPPGIVSFLGLLLVATILGIITLAVMGPRVTPPPLAGRPVPSVSSTSTTTPALAATPTTAPTQASLSPTEPTLSNDGRGTPHDHKNKEKHN